MAMKTWRNVSGWLLLTLALVCALPRAGLAQDLIYRVEAGDTLMALGEALLAKPQDWTELQRINQVADPLRLPVGQELRIPRALLRAFPRSGEVLAVSGEARLDGREAAVGARVGAGSQLDTGESGHLVIQLPDGSQLVLPARSSARIETLEGYAGTDEQSVDVYLHGGRVESRVAPQRGPSARYRVETPTAVIGVRGTEFRAAHDLALQRSRAEVVGGSVGLRPVAGRAREYRLGQGFGFAVDEEGGSGVVRLLPTPDVSGLPTLFERPVVRMPLPKLEAAQAWRVQVARAGNARSVLFDQRVASGPVRIPDLPDGEYLMQVRGIDANGLEGFDALHAFSLQARPEPPFTSMPTDGGKVPAGTVELNWTHAPEAARYAVELAARPVADDGNEKKSFPPADVFAEPLLSEDGLKGVSLSTELAAGEYVWRVASLRASGERGPWSDPQSFAVRPLQALTEPPAVGRDEMIFRWAGEAGQRFEYQFSDEESFARVESEGATELPELVLPRPSGGTWYLRIRAIDADGYVNAWGGAQRVDVPGPWWMVLLPLLAL